MKLWETLGTLILDEHFTRRKLGDVGSQDAFCLTVQCREVEKKLGDVVSI